jgi:hypothetical protein
MSTDPTTIAPVATDPAPPSVWSVILGHAITGIGVLLLVSLSEIAKIGVANAHAADWGDAAIRGAIAGLLAAGVNTVQRSMSRSAK